MVPCRASYRTWLAIILYILNAKKPPSSVSKVAYVVYADIFISASKKLYVVFGTNALIFSNSC